MHDVLRRLKDAKDSRARWNNDDDRGGRLARQRLKISERGRTAKDPGHFSRCFVLSRHFGPCWLCPQCKYNPQTTATRDSPVKDRYSSPAEHQLTAGCRLKQVDRANEHDALLTVFNFRLLFGPPTTKRRQAGRSKALNLFQLTHAIYYIKLCKG